MITPDIGPKMYNAHSSIHQGSHVGSTKLHMDITCAVNILLWAARSPNGEEGGALWTIFDYESNEKLREFLRNEYKFTGPGDPIHSQSIWVTDSMLQRLREDYGVRFYTIVQHPGEAVFIPAGCPHQVSNLTDSIKLACDFVSPENLLRTQSLIKEFREQYLATGWGDDVLQYYTTLWYAWITLSSQLQGFPLPEAPAPKQQDRNSTRGGEFKHRCTYCKHGLLNRAGIIDHLLLMHSPPVTISGSQKSKWTRTKNPLSDEAFQEFLDKVCVPMPTMNCPQAEDLMQE